MNSDLFPEELKILSPKEIARILGVSLGTFHKIRKDEGFPPRRHFGAETRGWLFKDIREWAMNRPEG